MFSRRARSAPIALRKPLEVEVEEKSTNALRMLKKHYKQPKYRQGIVVLSIILLARSAFVLVSGICAIGFGLKAIKGRSNSLKLSKDDSANGEMSSLQPSELEDQPQENELKS